MIIVKQCDFFQSTFGHIIFTGYYCAVGLCIFCQQSSYCLIS